MVGIVRKETNTTIIDPFCQNAGVKLHPYVRSVRRCKCPTATQRSFGRSKSVPAPFHLEATKDPQPFFYLFDPRVEGEAVPVRGDVAGPKVGLVQTVALLEGAAADEVLKLEAERVQGRRIVVQVPCSFFLRFQNEKYLVSEFEPVPLREVHELVYKVEICRVNQVS